MSHSPRLSSQASLLVTERTQHKRRPQRGSHERALIDAILDEALVCHVGVSLLDGPRVLPTAHVRVGDQLYVHGARKNHLFAALLDGPGCVTVTLIDGLIFARSAFHHSMNYRSVVLFGRASEVTDLEEKRAALHALVEHIAPGRAQEATAPTEEELATTLVVRFPIVEGSAKVRSGPPLDAAHEANHGIWAGELPLRLTASAPQQDDLDDVPPALSPAVLARARSLSPRASALALGADHAGHVPYERTITLANAPALLAGELSLSTDRARIDVAGVHAFLSHDSYWAKGLSEASFRRSCSESLCFGVYRGREQLAFARVVTDFARFAYLADVFVPEALRGHGLGKRLVEEVLQHPALVDVERWLLGTRDAHSLYERFGFFKLPEGRYMLRAAR